MAPGTFDSGAALAAWGVIRARYPSYDLVLPGANSFNCRAETCNAWCCRALSVPLGDVDVERMERVTRLAPADFLECENGEPIALPLRDPYLMARAGGACVLLGKDLACSRYHGRPAACRLYPFQVLVVDEREGRPVRPGTGAIPLLLRHRECPGFTGPPLQEEAWATLLRETALLQYPDTAAANWPGR